MRVINYLEDYQLEDIKESVGESHYVPYGSPTGAGRILKVGKSYTTFESVVKEYCSDPKGEVGVKFKLPNRIAYNVIG